MDYRRSVTQTASKVQPSKTSMMKTKSEVSLTPSQMAELEKQNARKSPLDALSRTVIRPQGFERRSGLQDVDDSYLKKNVFTKPLFARNSGLGEVYSNTAPATGAQIANTRQVGGGGYADVAQGSVAQANMYAQQPPQVQAQAQIGQQQNTPVQIQQAQNIPAAGASSGHGHAHRQQMHHQQTHQQHAQQQHAQQQHAQQQHTQQQHAQQQHAQQQQAQYQQQQQHAQLAQQQQAQYQQQQQQAQLIQQQQQAQYQQQQQPQYQQQQQAQYQQQQAQHAPNAQQQLSPQQQQQYQQQTPPAVIQSGANAVPPTPEPDMCTTCPNCQTTIYLVRGNETNYDGSQPPVQQ